jgi:plasmid stabilization system protein ParE
MPYRIIITAFAEEDLKLAAGWYAAQRDRLDIEFIQEIENTIQRIQQNPRQFAIVRKQIRMSIVKRFPYGVYFFVTGEVINVFAVFHFSRNPKTLKQRTTPIREKRS